MEAHSESATARRYAIVIPSYGRAASIGDKTLRLLRRHGLLGDGKDAVPVTVYVGGGQLEAYRAALATDYAEVALVACPLGLCAARNAIVDAHPLGARLAFFDDDVEEVEELVVGGGGGEASRGAEADDTDDDSHDDSRGDAAAADAPRLAPVADLAALIRSMWEAMEAQHKVLGGVYACRNPRFMAGARAPTTTSTCFIVGAFYLLVNDRSHVTLLPEDHERSLQHAGASIRFNHVTVATRYWCKRGGMHAAHPDRAERDAQDKAALAAAHPDAVTLVDKGGGRVELRYGTARPDAAAMRVKLAEAAPRTDVPPPRGAPLTAAQRDALAAVRVELERVPVPVSSQRATAGGGTSEGGGARTVTLGMVNKRASRGVHLSKLSYTRPLLHHLVSAFGATLQLRWNAVTINEDVRCELHTDSGNVGDSYIVAFGDFTGGLLHVHGCGEYDIAAEGLVFDGSKLAHSTTAFSGKRYSLVFYSAKGAPDGALDTYVARPLPCIADPRYSRSLAYGWGMFRGNVLIAGEDDVLGTGSGDGDAHKKRPRTEVETTEAAAEAAGADAPEVAPAAPPPKKKKKKVRRVIVSSEEAPAATTKPTFPLSPRAARPATPSAPHAVLTPTSGTESEVEVVQLGHGACTAAAARGDLALLQFVRARGGAWDRGTSLAAAKGGHAAVLRWLREAGCPYDDAACLDALLNR